METIIFYTKPGCKGGIKQKAHLEDLGYTVDVRSIFETGFGPEELRTFFGSKPIKSWYNLTAPDVKSGLVVPGSKSEIESLLELCGDPILIKRPLMIIGDKKISSFDHDLLSEVISGFKVPAEDLDACQKKAEMKFEI